MSIFAAEPQQYGGPALAPAAAPDGFAANVAAAFEAARRTQNVNSFGVLQAEEYAAQIAAVERETGERLQSPLSGRYDEVEAAWRDRFFELRRSGMTVSDIAGLRRDLNIAAYDARLAALREKYPNAASLYGREELDRRMRARAQSLDARFETIGPVAGLVGGLGAALTDPVTLATAPVGVSSKTVLGAVVRNAALNAGIETALQPGVQAARGRLGLSSGFQEGAVNVLFAAGAGGVLGGAGKGAERLIALGRGSPDPVIRAGAAEVERDLEVAALAEEATGAAPTPASLAALNERLDAVQRVIEGDDIAPADVRAVRAEGEAVAFRPVRRDAAVTPTGREVPVEYGIVELSSLRASHTRDFTRNPAYPAELQPRDRGRAASAAQVTKIASDLNPRLLDDAAGAGDGAPIVAPDGVVESGNGRVLALQRVYDAGGDKAAAYRDYLAGRGYPVEGVAEPVLVRRRTGELSDADRAAFTREANARSTAAMSASEQASADAAALKPDDFSVFDGADPTAVKNQNFIRQVVARIAPEAERAAMMDKTGRLSPEGAGRVRNAIFAYAYDDAALVGRLLETDELKSLGLAMVDAAPEFGRLRADLDAGLVDRRADMRPFIAEAANVVAEARRTGRNVAEFVGQQDIFAGAMDARTAAFLRLFFRNDDFTGVRSRAKIAEELNFYAREARKAKAGPSLLGDDGDPGQRILDALRRGGGGDDAGAAPGLFDAGEDAGAASLLPDAGGGGRGAEAPRGGIEEAEPPAQIAAAADDLAGLPDDEGLVTGALDVADDGETPVIRTQTKAELDAEFAADEAAIARLKGCVT